MEWYAHETSLAVFAGMLTPGFSDIHSTICYELTCGRRNGKDQYGGGLFVFSCDEVRFAFSFVTRLAQMRVTVGDLEIHDKGIDVRRPMDEGDRKALQKDKPLLSEFMKHPLARKVRITSATRIKPGKWDDSGKDNGVRLAAPTGRIESIDLRPHQGATLSPKLAADAMRRFDKAAPKLNPKTVEAIRRLPEGQRAEMARYLMGKGSSTYINGYGLYLSVPKRLREQMWQCDDARRLDPGLMEPHR